MTDCLIHCLIPVYHRGRLAGTAIVDPDVWDEFSSRLWHLTVSGHAVRNVSSKSSASTAMHRQICGIPRGDGRVVHHVNENPLDNRRANLEVCENASIANSRPHPLRDAAGREGMRRYRERIA